KSTPPVQSPSLHLIVTRPDIAVRFRAPGLGRCEPPPAMPDCATPMFYARLRALPRLSTCAIVETVRIDLTARDARWLALDAQRLARPRSANKAGRNQLLAVVEQLGAVQLDAVNVLERTQYIVMWSRVG